MTLRTKTIEYAFPLGTASVATAVARTWAALTVNIPETTTRTFRSVVLEFSMRDNQATAASVTAVNLSVQINAVAVSAATVTQTITNSGENQSYIFTKDVTAYFQTNFTGATNTVTPAITVTGAATINASCRLIITYEYDDAAATTRIKTVKIPVDGAITALTATFANLGGVASQIPNLSTFLPEASKVYRSIFFVWETHTGTTTAAASTLDISYDGGTTTVSDGSHANTLKSDVFYRRIDDLTATLSTVAGGTIQAKVTSITGMPCNCLCGHLVVTYEYDHSASTQIMNSVQLAVMDEVGMTGGPTTADKSRFQRDISVQEPGTITLAQSGVFVSYIASDAMVLDLRVGAQASRTFTTAAAARSGSVSSMRRIDGGAAGGAGMTLARGLYNSFVVDWFATGSTLGTIPSNMSGMLFLNYTSDKHASGDGVHAHTTQWCITPYSTGFTGTSSSRVQVTSATTPNIPETEYWLGGLGYYITLMTNGTTAANFGFAMLCEVQAAESEGAGWRGIYSCMYESDLEVGPSICIARARDDFQRWPQDPDTDRLNIETARSYRYDNSLIVSTSAGVIPQSMALVTYHAITYAIAGNITGSAGGTVNIDAHRSGDGIEIAATSRVGDGAYSMPWYDNLTTVYVEAYEDGTHIGRSDTAVAV